jgi:hypothetical protein
MSPPLGQALFWIAYAHIVQRGRGKVNQGIFLAFGGACNFAAGMLQ